MNNRKRQKNNKKKIIKDDLIVDVSGKREIQIIAENNEKAVVEIELKILKKEFDEIEKNIKSMYYDNNAIVDRVESRNFFDLLKLVKIKRTKS